MLKGLNQIRLVSHSPPMINRVSIVLPIQNFQLRFFLVIINFNSFNNVNESVEDKLNRIKKEKEDYLMKFDRLKRLGYNIPYQFNMTSDLDTMKYEYEKLKKEKDIEKIVTWILSI